MTFKEIKRRLLLKLKKRNIDARNVSNVSNNRHKTRYLRKLLMKKIKQLSNSLKSFLTNLREKF